MRDTTHMRPANAFNGRWLLTGASLEDETTKRKLEREMSY